jgi:hypothetical protein
MPACAEKETTFVKHLKQLLSFLGSRIAPALDALDSQIRFGEVVLPVILEIGVVVMCLDVRGLLAFLFGLSWVCKGKCKRMRHYILHSQIELQLHQQIY